MFIRRVIPIGRIMLYVLERPWPSYVAIAGRAKRGHRIYIKAMAADPHLDSCHRHGELAIHRADKRTRPAKLTRTATWIGNNRSHTPAMPLNATVVSPLPEAVIRGPGRPRQFDLEALLDKAVGVFSEFGYHATSITNLSAATGVTPGSLYKAFRDKRAVFAASWKHYLRLRAGQMNDALSGAASGYDRVRAVLSVYARNSQGAEGRRGCLIVGSAVELASSDAAVARQVARVMAGHEQRFAEFIKQGQEDGSIPALVEPAVAARLLLCVVQGMRVVGKTGRTKDEMDSLVDVAMKVLA